MTASPLTRRLLDDAAQVARARGVAVQISYGRATITLLPDSAAAAQPAAGGNSCDDVLRLMGSG